MIRSLASGLLETSIRKGQFAIKPAKAAYKRHKEKAPKLTYNAWVIDNEEKCFVRGEIKSPPKISIVVPAYNTDPSHFLAMVYSVANQHYENWQMVIVNASDDPKLKEKISKSGDIDTRIKVVTPEKNLGIAGNTNFGLKYCTGDYVAFLDHDDLLHICALHSVAAIAEQTEAGIIYSDEDKVKDDSSMFFDPFFKPRWSPDLFENVNYINHFTAIKKELVDRVKGLRPKFDGAQDYDLLLRVIDTGKPRIEHISRILYHWRAAATSTANDISTKTYVLDAGQGALKEHLQRLNIKGSAEAIPNMPGFYKTLPSTPKSLSVVIGPVDQENHRLCILWLQELWKKIPKDIKTELIIGEWFKDYQTDSSSFGKIHYIPRGNSYWDKAGKAVNHHTILCFGTAALPNGDGAITELISQASQENRFVSPMILGGKMIFDAGLVESDHGKQRLFTGCQLGDNTYYGYTGFIRNVAGMTLDIFATDHLNFTKLTEGKKGEALSDADLDKVKTPDTRLIINPRAAFDFRGPLSLSKFRNDQYFNPQLTQAHTDLYVKVPYWRKLKELSRRDNVED